MNKPQSSLVPIAPSIGFQKLGQPVRLSYLVSDQYSGRSHPAQWYTPGA